MLNVMAVVAFKFLFLAGLSGLVMLLITQRKGAQGDGKAKQVRQVRSRRY